MFKDARWLGIIADHCRSAGSGDTKNEDGQLSNGEKGNYNDESTEIPAQTMARINLKFLNAASRERFPFGVPHESQRYMQRSNRDQRRPKEK